MGRSGTDLLAVYITSIHIILNQSASCNVSLAVFVPGEAEQLPQRHSGFKHDDKVHRLPSAICEILINHQLEDDSNKVIRIYLLAYFS